MYRVVRFFTDSCDDGYAYEVGDEYPRKGLDVSEDRLKTLSSDKNRQNTPVIVKVDAPVRTEPKKAVPKSKKK